MVVLREITGAEPDLASLFAPGSIAVVGASGKPYSISWWPGQLLRRYGYAGDVYLVNPKRSEIDGVRTYPSLADLPAVPDAAVITLNAEGTLAAVEECARLGVKSVVLPSQGFGETGEEGKAREARLRDIVRTSNMRIVGPNTDGIANPKNGAMMSIQPLLGEGLTAGPVAVVTQSGATAGSLLARLAAEGIGCGLYASAGNEIDLGLADFMSIAVQDPEIKIVLSFVESLRRPNDFERVAALAAELDKPIALIKVGRSQQGARRAAAHTGAMAGEDAMYSAMFHKYGVIRVDELSDLVAITRYFLAVGTPRSRGIGIFSVSGGQAGAVADQAVAAGLEVPSLEEEAERDIDALLAFGTGFNPCDLTGEIAKDPSLASKVYKIFATQNLGAVVYARKTLSGALGVRAAELLAESVAPAGTVPLVCYAFDGSMSEAERAAYDRGGIPVFTTMHEICTAISTLYDRGRRVGRVSIPPVRSLSRPVVTAVPMADRTAKALLAEYGFPLPAERLVTDRAEAIAAAETLTSPVVLKVVDERVPHKTEAGGVIMNLVDADQVGAAFDRLVANVTSYLGGASPAGVLVQEQVPPGVEMIVGARVDPALGPFVLVGMGGIWTEVLKDFSIRLAPLTEADAHEMLAELKGQPLLQGFRGAEAADVKSLVEVILNVSRLVTEREREIVEMDLNPLIVGPVGHGTVVADVLIFTPKEL